MNSYQGETFGTGEASITHPSLEGAEVVREVFTKHGDSLAMCTIRMRMPDGEEDLHTYIYSHEPITFSSTNECEDDESCTIERRPNPFGPYREHYIFAQVDPIEEDSGG